MIASMVFTLLSLTAHPPAVAQDHPIVTDGDTLKFGKQRVRLYGIDAPEMQQTCDNGAWPAGAIAREALVEIIGEEPVICEQVDWDKRYGRPVSRCTAGGVDVFEAMVRRGMAWAFVRYSRAFIEVEKAASTQRLGIHGHQCEEAWEWRRMKRQERSKDQ